MRNILQRFKIHGKWSLFAYQQIGKWYSKSKRAFQFKRDASSFFPCKFDPFPCDSVPILKPGSKWMLWYFKSTSKKCAGVMSNFHKLIKWKLKSAFTATIIISTDTVHCFEERRIFGKGQYRTDSSSAYSMTFLHIYICFFL